MDFMVHLVTLEKGIKIKDRGLVMLLQSPFVALGVIEMKCHLCPWSRLKKTRAWHLTTFPSNFFTAVTNWTQWVGFG